MNAREVKKAFKRDILPQVVKQYGKDKVAIRTAFNDYTDYLCKDGVISQKTYDTIIL